MAPLSFAHITGRAGWLECDWRGVLVDDATRSLRLVTDLEDSDTGTLDETVWEAWHAKRGGAIWRPLGPERCAEREAWLADRSGLSRWDGEAWTTVPGSSLGPCLSLDADRDGRIWVLDEVAGAARLRGHSALDLSPIATVPVPAGLRQIATCADGLYGIDASSLLRHDGATWRAVAAPEPLDTFAPVALARWGQGVTVLYRRKGTTVTDPALCGLALVRRERVEGGMLRGLSAGLGLLVLDDGDVLVGELVPTTGVMKARMRFGRYQHQATATGLDWHNIEAWDVVGFDGHALFVDAAGEPWGTSERGPRRLYRQRSTFVGAARPKATGEVVGEVTTPWLDADTAATSWHRVFLDVALPEGASLRLHVRASDSLDFTTKDPPPWISVPHLDRRPARADRPFPMPGQVPSGEDVALIRNVDLRESVAFDTLEGLLPTRPGRYLQLKVELVGTKRSSPTLVGLRATWPRPSMLAWLPASWRDLDERTDDPTEDAAEDPTETPTVERAPEGAASLRLERLLALFEGLLTELEGRIDALPLLWDPAVTPAEALPWLAGLLGLSLDTRLREGVRRQILLEAAALHRQRGTVGGIRRMAEILASCHVQVVESFRHRRATGARLGVEASRPHETPGAVLGPGLVLGEGMGDPADWYAGFAHRFSVLIFRAADPDLSEVVTRMVSELCPAHTEFELCWVGDGFRLGVGSFVGLGTALGPSEQELGPVALVLGPDGPPLGGWPTAGPTTLPHPASLFATFPGVMPGDSRSSS